MAESEPLNLLVHEQCVASTVPLKPGDVIVLSFKERLSPEWFCRIKECMEKEYFPGHKCLILQGGATLTVVAPLEYSTTVDPNDIDPDHVGYPRQ